MGPERVLQATRRLTLALVALSSVASAAPAERIAIIDVGPADAGQARQVIASAIIEGGLSPLVGDGLDDALAGREIAPDAAQLAKALAQAQRAFGALDCVAATAAARQAIGLAAARQAGGLAVPELPRAWTYVLLCADRRNDTGAALHAATRLRLLGGTTDVPAELLAKYPEVDALLDRELFSLEISADVAGAAIWVDGARVGVAPVTVKLRAGEHVIAAALGDKRGFAAGTASAAQTKLVVPTPLQRAPLGAVARRVASWGGNTPAASEIAAILAATSVRIAFVRRGDALEVWGRSGGKEPPHRLGGDEDGVGTLADAPRMVELIKDRVQTWNDRAVDPDQPAILREDDVPKQSKKAGDAPTKWWVYATVIGAALAGGTFLLFSETADNTQHVKLYVP